MLVQLSLTGSRCSMPIIMLGGEPVSMELNKESIKTRRTIFNSRKGQLKGVSSISGSRRRKSGFTLIEVVIAIFALAAAASVLFVMLPASLKTGKMVGNHQQASSIVQHKVDQLRGVGWGRLNYTELMNAGIIDASPAVSPYSFVIVDELDGIYAESVATIKIEDATP